MAVITGGSKGLGRQISIAMSREGSQVVICSRNKNDLEDVKNEINRRGGRCDCHVVDVSDKKQVDKFIDDIVASYGKIDILVNNAGYVNVPDSVENTSEEEFERCVKVNMYSVFYFLKKAIPIMRKQKSGIIINVASTAGKRGVPNLSAYSASKFAVIGLTQAVGKEVKDDNITCIVVCPGGMNTEMRAKVFGQEDAKKQQDPEVVANIIMDIIDGKINVPSAGSISIRYGKITIDPAPE